MILKFAKRTMKRFCTSRDNAKLSIRRVARIIIRQAFSLVFLLGTAVYADGSSQTFVLQRGWNLITFQVLPPNRTPVAVFGAMISELGAKLYDIDPAKNRLGAVYTAKREGAALHWEKFTIVTPPSFPNTTSIPPPPAIDSSTASDLAQIEFGRGYFVYLESLPINSVYSITGELILAGSGISLENGWNLLGVSGNLPEQKTTGIAAEPPRRINVFSIFKQADLEKITAVVRWEARSGRYQYYYPREPERSEFQFFEPNLAHWVQANSPLTVRPVMIVQALGDSDVQPLSEPPVQDNLPWNPGPEDVSIRPPHMSPVYHTKETQEFVLISTGQNSVTLPLYNNGGGILGWSAVLRPFSGPTMAPSIPLMTPNDVKLVLSLKRDRGITTSEPDAVEVNVDRTHLASGTYLARLEIEGDTGQRREFTLMVDVGGLEGQWKGTATIETINGRRNPVADVDLFIHLFKDNVPGSEQLRGIIDGQETMLWPMDAQLMGHIADFPASTGVDPNYSSRFVISGGYTLPPGDANRFPFDSFPEPGGSPPPQQAVDLDTGLKYLTNDEGDRFYVDLTDRVQKVEASGTMKLRPNFTNPLNRFLSREVELVGQMSGTDISQGGADVLTGEYNETITGMLSQPLHLRGHFRLVRKGHTTFERRPLKLFYVTPSGGRSINASQSFGEPANERITVDSHILINRVVVVVAHDIPDVKHTLTLTGPGTPPKTITLHSRQKVGPAQFVIYDSGDLPLNTLGLLDPPELQPNGARPLPTATTTGLDVLKYEADLRNSLSNYVVRRPRESLISAFKGIDAFGEWRLKLTNTDAGVHNMLGWSLLIYGVPTHRVEGRVVVDGSDDPDRFNDVAIRVNGLNADLGSVLTKFDKATGHFSISHLPGIRVNIVATKPGFPPSTIDGLNTPDDPRGYRDGFQGIIPGDQTLIRSGTSTLEYTITLRQPPSGLLGILKNAAFFTGGAALLFQPTTGSVNAYPRMFTASSTSGNVIIDNLQLTYRGSLPPGVTESQIRWQFDGDGASTITSVPAIISGRAPIVRLSIPESSFTSANRYMIGLRPKAVLGSTTTELKFEDWVVIVLANPPPGSVSQTFLIQGSILTGFGGFPQTDPNKLALHGQKTDVSKVDIDRPPLINESLNPTLNFGADGFAEPGGGDGEDTDLHPRTFDKHPPNQNGNRFAYAEIIASPDLMYKKLSTPASGSVPDYDDRNQGINGRDINAPKEPVRIFTTIGDRVIDQCVSLRVGDQIINQCGSATDGKVRISAGTNPGPSVRR